MAIANFFAVLARGDAFGVRGEECRLGDEEQAAESDLLGRTFATLNRKNTGFPADSTTRLVASWEAGAEMATTRHDTPGGPCFFVRRAD